MKKRIVFIFLTLSSLAINAQKSSKVGYIDMDFILEKMPEYAEAKNNLEERANKWKQDIEVKKAKLTKLKENLAAEKVLLTKELIADKEEEIKTLEKEILDEQQKRFGPQGDLVIQKGALIKPIQDQVFNIVQDYAAKRKYDFIFDKSSDLTIMFADVRFDISEEVLKEIERAGRKVELTKKQAKKLEIEEEKRLDRKENPEIAEKEEAIKATQEERQKKLDERKAANEAKRKEADDKRKALQAERAAARQKLIDEQKAKKEALLKEKQQKAEENKQKQQEQKKN